MDTYRDPVFLECGHTVCRSCALTALVAAARLAALPTAPVSSTTGTTKPHAHGGGGCGGGVGTMPGPGQTSAPQSTAALSCGTSSSSSSGCRWGCCSPGATVEIRCPFRCTRTTRTTMSGENLKPNTAAMSLIESRKAELTKSALCEAQYCCEEPTSSPSPATCRCSSCHDMIFCGPCFMQHHQRGAFRAHQCNSLEALVKNHQALISKANEVSQQQQPLEVLQAHSMLSSFLLDKPLLLDTHRLEPCEQAKGVKCRSGPRDEVIGMIKGFGTVSKGRVPNTPSEGRAPQCSRSPAATPTDTDAIAVKWDQPPPLLDQTPLEQVVGYNVIVSPSNFVASASSTKGRVAMVIEVKGKETTKCDVTVASKSEVSVAVCAVSLVGSSEPTQRATVPRLPPTREVEVFAWGAAGGANNNGPAAGGPGGFSTARMLIKTGTQLTIVVGQGGAGMICQPSGDPPATRRSFGGGGSGGSGGRRGYHLSGGGGGGCSAVMVGGVPLVVAGGGGGSAIQFNTHGHGGGGGGETGSADGDQCKRATQEAPGGWGDNSPQCGDKFRGGDGANAGTGTSDCGGGGGGGGLYGGGGGHTYSVGQGDSGGGGGSGFVVAPTTTTSSSASGGGVVVGDGGCVVSVISSRTVCGQRATARAQTTTPPETNNEHYRDGAGGCVAPTTYDHPVDGNHGLVVVVVKGGTGSANTNTNTHVFNHTGQNQSLTIN
ncbi:hypothetical protein Pelo_15237 [Pelomyxa schiedti]|nr:hypothetical protein Pelo_15237 [Pelomyxa schiedti]